MQSNFMRVMFATFLATLAFAATLDAQTTQPSGEGRGDRASTRPAQTPVLSDKTVLSADVAYGGPDAKLNSLDIYAPKGASGAPILLFVHGGEWSRGDKLAVSCKPQYFNDHGVIFVSTNYRLSPKDPHPAQVDDVARAIAFLHEHATEYGGDPNKIVIIGHSAGCHLVTLVALNPSSLEKVKLKPSDIRGVVAWSGGMYDLVARANGGGMYPPFIKATFGDDAAAQKAGSPMTYVTNAKSCPPFLIASCDDERSKTSREASEEMIKQINSNGGKADEEILVGKTYFTAIHEIGAAGDQTAPRLLNFVETVTK